MKIYVNQSIQINILRINSVTNSSVLQIGTAGRIKSQANIYNTGQFTQPAPEPIQDGFVTPSIEAIPLPLQF
ncbi:spore germination protein GerPB [Fervidibacillus albus]|uniref:Spore germination protein GerPB n=1 Tax=Fervidibacillus albus TaxID=2980026 RepID=A0A9E8RV99_9BACI|nr:spore germination protein GerPB [Fervidibacillus albus]WAA08688.1 spore germination protein GerPB [Fervidibacillus albus]